MMRIIIKLKAYVVVLNFGAEEAAIDLNSLGAGVLPKGKTLTAAEVR